MQDAIINENKNRIIIEMTRGILASFRAVRYTGTYPTNR